MNGQSAHFILLDECLLLRPETNLQPPTVNTINTVRTIVAKHLPENEPLPKRNWLQRWVTNPEPGERPVEHRIVTVDTPEPVKHYTWENHVAAVETPYADSMMSHITEAHLNAIGEARREAARDGVFVAVHHLEKHLSNLSSETMTDTIARAATQDCIEILRKLRRDMANQESGGA